MLSESDLFYYVALAIVCFIVLYIIYITLNFQNNVMESFSLGGGNKDKKEKQTKESKAVERLEEENQVLEDALNIKDNKKDYVDLLQETRRKIILEGLNQIVTGGLDDKTKWTKIAIDSIDEFIEFVDKE
jgi:hypothetical protein